jgi:RNA polymerase sigma factor (sigma-70 family)
MSDYRIRITVRNARLLRTIEHAGHRPGAQFADAVGISYHNALLPYLNLTRSPLRHDGLLRDCAWALCDFLQASPSDLWSDEQLQPLAQHQSSVDLDADSVSALITGAPAANDPLRLASHSEVGRLLQQAIDSLTPREADVIRERFFVGSTLDEVAQHLEITRERVRQIETRALHKLRQDSRTPRDLAGLADVIGGSADA